MQFALSIAFVVALVFAVVQPALSVPALTAPVASTTGHGGRTLRLAYADNGNSPKLSSWDGVNIFLAAGSENTQYKLQQLATNVSVSRKSGSYVVDASIGPNGPYYFIRMESLARNSSSGYPYMAFSARFTLADMTGTFNSTVLSAAQGAEGSASSSSSSSSSRSSSSSSRSTSTSTGSTAASSATSASSSSSTSSAGKTQQAMIFVGSAAAAALGLVALM